MKNRQLYRKDERFLRVLRTDKERVLVIDCVKRTSVPKWIELSEMEGFAECSEEELLEATGKVFAEMSELSEKQIAVMNERYAMVSGMVAYVGNDVLRNEAIEMAVEEHKIGKQSIKRYLCDYLAFNNKMALAPKIRAERELTDDEKNMRWSLNKFYYNINKNSLKNAYLLMLRHKYCDKEGKLVEKYPSYSQYRYFFRKTKNLQKLYITREGMSAYQRNFRPLLGENVQAFAPDIGYVMLDSTVCDIYLVNETGDVVGRPNLTIGVDTYSGMCVAYSLTWQGGMYSLRNLILNMISDKVEHCRRLGIEIKKEDWNVSELPTVFITDKGSEYRSENFEQITELGIKVINLKSYRPELKGPVEKCFDCIQSAYKKYLQGKGIVEKDYLERGRHDYRKDASLTLEQFEKVVLHCILFYNTKRIVNNFPFSEEMLEENISPYSNAIWNYQKEQGAELITVSEDKLIKTLLPRTVGKFKRNGLNVNGLRYKNENYNEHYLEGNEVNVAYSPDNVGRVWLIENGCYVEFKLIETRFKEKELEEVNEIKSKQKELCKSEKERMTQAEIDLAESILLIREQARNTKPKTINNIRENRKKEEKRTHKEFI